MRKAACLVVMLAMHLPAVAFQAKGMGFIFIEPAGLSLKMWFQRGAGFQAAAGWSSRRGNPFQVQADYQFFQRGLYQSLSSEFRFYAGAGARLDFHSDIRVSVRIPLGLDFQSWDVPLNLFLELTPLVNLNPTVGIDLRAALGVRYLFDGFRPGR